MKKIIYIIAGLCLISCNKTNKFDAQGTFEAREITISSETNGKILSFPIEEGMEIKADETLGQIDTIQLHFQRKQLSAQLSALLASRPDTQKQVASLQKQIAKQKSELKRVENMLKDNAATKKQYEDIEAQIKILETQLSATLSTLNKNTTSINENALALEAQISSLEDRISKSKITSPINGTILVKYAQEGETTVSGKPLLKVADLENIYLRAYFTSEQLPKIKVGNKVKVIADFGGEERYEYEGKITWISSQSEFTPKSIQTANSRANLVYGVKIAVKNDGRLKLGLSGEVIL